MQVGGRRTNSYYMTKLIVPFANVPKYRCTSDFKYQSKSPTNINDNFKSVKT